MVNQPANWQRYTAITPQYGLVVAPAAGAVIADSGALPAGIYRVDASGSYGGTPDVIDNFALFLGLNKLVTLPAAPVANAGIMTFTLPAVVVYEGQHLSIHSIVAGAVGSVYRGLLVCTPVQSQDPL